MKSWILAPTRRETKEDETNQKANPRCVGGKMGQGEGAAENGKMGRKKGSETSFRKTAGNDCSKKKKDLGSV